MKCTWRGCESEGVHVKYDKQGHPWAALCDEHGAQFSADVESLSPGRLLRAWSLAGADHPRRQVAREAIAASGARLFEALQSLRKGK